MRKFFASILHGLKRTVPVLVAGGIALIGSKGFDHFVSNHPAVTAFVPVIVWLLHTAAHSYGQKTA